MNTLLLKINIRIISAGLWSLATIFTADYIYAAAVSGHTDSEEWWAFQPRTVPDVPVDKKDNWSVNQVDRFIFQKLLDKNMEPAPPAPAETLIRRVYFDLIGLPPTPEEIEAYLNDSSPDPWSNIIDRLLDDPRYGEHWARFWLDLVRYAESDGWNKDSYRSNMWRYRDYVVNAFNTDKPYPEFVKEQLAGDEMPGDNPEQIIATGYLRLGIYEYNQRDARSQWNDIMNEITDVTGDAFLGLSMSCCRCHNHKFDPIPQSDYFGLRSFFEPLVWTDEVPGATKEERDVWQIKQEVWEADTADIREEIDVLCEPYYKKKWDSTVDKFPLEIQDCFNKPEEQRNSWEHQMAYLVTRQFYEEGEPALKSMKEEDKVLLTELEEKLKAFDEIKPKPLPVVMSIKDFSQNISPTVIPGDSSGTAFPPRFPEVLASYEPEIMPGPASSGRRTALAEWITQPDNPLTIRLFVNRIWQQHFGEGMSRSASEFGRLGHQPTHPELLDWLTDAYINNGWSTKYLHKLILKSSVWRQSVQHPQTALYLQIDPEEKYLWRAKVRRLKAEEIRDAVLSVSAKLDAKTGGPGVKSDVPRRSLYVISKRNTPEPLLSCFDAADGLTSISKRANTVTPSQALMMINGDFVLNYAKQFGARLRKLEGSGARNALAYGFRLAWGREATEDELDKAHDFVFPEFNDDPSRMYSHRLIDFCHVLFNANEFLYLD